MRACVLDIEGDGLAEVNIDGKSKRISSEVKAVHCFAVAPVGKNACHLFDPDNLKQGIEYLQEFDCWIGHNIIAYDLPTMVRVLKVKPPKSVLDTLLVSRFMYPDHQANPMGGNSLWHWGQRLRCPKIEFDGGWNSYSKDMGKYCVQDTRLGRKILEAQMPYIIKHREHLMFEHDVAMVLAKQTDFGFGYKVKKGRKLYIDLCQRQEDIYDEFQKIFPPITTKRISEKTGKRLKDKVEIFNPGSRPMIASRLVAKYKWEPPRNEATKRFPQGSPKIDEEVLATLKYPEAVKLVEYFDLKKQVGMITDWNTRAELSRDGRIHGSINSLGAVTTRCTHAQPNISQVTKIEEIRRLWYPGIKGWYQLGGDLSGIELRGLGHYLAEWDGGRYAEIASTGDIHLHNADKAGIKGDNRRDISKRFIYAYLYGAAALKLSIVLGCSESKAQKIKNQFTNELEGLAELIEFVKGEHKRRKKLTLVDGRDVPIRSGHSALNTLLQGFGSIVSKRWLLLSAPDAKEAGAGQMAYSHDEMQFAVPSRAVGVRLGKKLVRNARLAGESLNLNVPIEAKYKIGRNWWDTH